MKKSTYLWSIRQLGIDEGEYLTLDLINEYYNNLGDFDDDNYLIAKNFLINNIDEINEYNGFDTIEYDQDLDYIDEYEEDEDEQIDRFLYRRKKLNTLLFSLIFVVIGIFIFIIFRGSNLFKSTKNYFDYQLYGDTYMVSLKEECDLEEITIPEKYDGITITRIGTFSSNTLKKITIHANIEVISDRAFSGCTALESINVPSSVENIGLKAFENCISLKSVIISGNITEIKDFTFYNCIELEDISLPNSVKIIGKNAFDGCVKMEGFSMPTNIVEIGDYAFANCRLINNISFGYNLYSIGNEAFKNCKSLEGILIPSSINYLGDFVFKCCDNLFSFEINKNNELKYVGQNILFDTLLYKRYNDNIYKTGGWIIFTKGDIGSIIIKENISKKAFYDTANTIKSIVFEDSVNYILEQSFYGINVEGIVIPSNVKVIGKEAFFGNKSLKVLTFKFDDPYVLFDKSIWSCFGYENTKGNLSLSSQLKIYVSSSVVELFKTELIDYTEIEFIKSCIYPY